MEIIIGIIIFVMGAVFGVLSYHFIKQSQKKSDIEIQNELELAFGKVSKDALNENIQTFLTLAEDQFKKLTSTSDAQLDEKKKLIDASVRDMRKSLENLTQETSALKGHMKESREGITQLTDTTSKLRQILSSSQARGQWGERMVEDILNFIGLVEGVNYVKQVQEGTGRPDYTFKLPKGKRINMDVKFPLSHYEKYIIESNDEIRDREKKSFIQDVKTHIKDVSKRDYINPADGTVNYVLLFIPNESIYSFLNKEDPELIDFSLSRKIVLCSPLTLYAVLSLIRQSVDNFALETKAADMQRLVQSFKEQWSKYTSKVETMGKSLQVVQNHYAELVGPRRNQLQRPVDQITELELTQDIKTISGESE